jgi:hypothetical protein
MQQTGTPKAIAGLQVVASSLRSHAASYVTGEDIRPNDVKQTFACVWGSVARSGLKEVAQNAQRPLKEFHVVG